MKILTFDVGGTLIKSGIFDENGGLYDYCEHKYEKAGKDGVYEVIEKLGKQYEFDGLSVSTAGLVDENKGEMIFCSDAIPGYTGAKIKTDFESIFKKPVWVMNDVNSAALGEGQYGSGKGCRDFICLTYGTGIGGAIVINGSVYSGKSGYAGEIGHIVTHFDGKLCVCGAKGCYNEYASASALTERCKRVDARIENGIDVFNNFHNTLIRQEIDRWIDEIVLGLVTVCHIFNPPLIILGGGIMKEKYIPQAVEQKLRCAVMPGYRDTSVLPAQLGNKAGLIGCAVNAVRRIKNDI